MDGLTLLGERRWDLQIVLCETVGIGWHRINADFGRRHFLKHFHHADSSID